MTIANCSLDLFDTPKALQSLCDLGTAIGGISGRKKPLISNEIKKTLDFYLCVLTFSVTSLAGVVANCINLAVYWRQGLKESISLGFFALSMSDLVVVTLPLMTASCYAAKLLLPASNIDFPSLHYVSSGWLRNMFYSVSSCFTAVLSVERCCCVILPFKVKVIFSRRRTTIAILTILTLHVFCFLPIFATHRLGWRPSRAVNATAIYKLRVYFLPGRKKIEGFNSTLMGIILPTVSQAVVTVCGVILINGLKSSSQLRITLTNRPDNNIQVQGSSSAGDERQQTSGEGERRTTTSDSEERRRGTDSKSEPQEGSGGQQLSKRDARLVKTMVLLVIIYSACNVPFLMMNYARRLVPDLNIRGSYQNTFSVSYSVVYVLGSLNASANVFVYYHTGTRFRDTLRAMLGLSPKGSKG